MLKKNLKKNQTFILNCSLFSVCLTLLFSGLVYAQPAVQPKPTVQALPKKICPDGFKKSVSKEVIYCLKSNLSLPQEDVAALCQELAQGKIGFKWTASLKTEGYQCPIGAKLTKKDQERSCVFEKLEMPKNTQDIKPYCHYLNKGYFGFSYTPN